MIKPNELTQQDIIDIVIVLTNLCRLDDLDMDVHNELVNVLNILDPENNI